MKKISLISMLFLFGLISACGFPQKDKDKGKNEQTIDETLDENLKDPVNADTIEVGTVEKTEEEWRQILKPKEFEILREAGTEPPFSNKYVDNKQEGIYYCGGCGLPVYSSKTKFHSGTGWPSFWAPIDDKLVVRQPDNRYGMTRTEVVCAQCGSHFGHIFPNNTVPSGERHCLNSLALDFKAMDL